ncbi:hypothetical protein ACFQ6Q_00555 [Streptomyces sp. NPDC056437]|uniref:hypothetical protein n=1 Tax=Streptomyces sp. NPDC056437 TaxID=3345816 RepID=UPI0036CC491F
MKDRTVSAARALHPSDSVTTDHQPTAPLDEALRQVVAREIGPRRPGVVYDNSVSTYRVLNVIRDLDEARRVLKRRAAQFAIELLDLHTGETSTVCTVWTGSDRVLTAVNA